MHNIALRSMVLSITLSCITTGILYPQTGPEGFASMDTLGRNGTTGGAGGPVITVYETIEFLEAIRSQGPCTIRVSGTIALTGMEDVRSDKTIEGVDTFGVITGGGLDLSGVSNVIIRNLLFRESADDAINVSGGAHHVWIDHCDLTDAFDGLVDIKRGSDFVTVSWNLFYNHVKTCLLGHSDTNAAQDSGRLHVTYHHNWFKGTEGRHPRARFSGLCHVYNNYYFDNKYGVASTMDAEVLAENNYFSDVTYPLLVGYGDSGPGDLVERGNIYNNCDTLPQVRGEVPEPPYPYVPDSAAAVPWRVFNGAGRKGYSPDSGVSSSAGLTGQLPDPAVLEQNYPNPFNPETVIEIDVQRPARVQAAVYTVHGRLVRVLVQEITDPGKYRFVFNAEGFPPGVYLCILRMEEGSVQVIKMVLLK